MKRFAQMAAALVIVGLVIVLALPSYSDYTPRASVAAAILYAGKIKSALESACSNGSFASINKVSDAGVLASDPMAYINRADLSRPTQTTVRLKATLTDIYGHPFFGLFPWKVISQGSSLDFEFTCTAERKFASRFTGSDIEPKYLPATMRGS
jgi:type II secretory pathway pseudopilin PulG